MRGVWIPGEPGLGPWLDDLRRIAPMPAPAVRLEFTLRPGRWVDLDTLVERAVRTTGAGRALHGLIATKRWGAPAGMRLRPVSAVTVARARPPGDTLLDVSADARPRGKADKAALRDLIAEAWGARPVLPGESWADVRTSAAGSLLGGVEAILDRLEPVLGRDPRGRAWQEFFPFDDRIVWLRLLRDPAGPALRLRAGAERGTGAERDAASPERPS